MSWWLWAFLGIFLLGGEMVTPGGFYMLFFGIGALLVGALVGLDVIQSAWMSWLLFSGFAIGSLLLLRPPLRRLMATDRGGVSPVDTMGGETAIVLEDIPPDGRGKAECRGSTWNAHNLGTRPLTKGQRSLVDHVDGITLWIKPE
ncbi:MAG: Putative activity regulator of membrane protease YbbK [Nitrospira sp.]|nr:MAG: Putative activity regulator of membrane protease YbbK [Nitrospira sp.]